MKKEALKKFMKVTFRKYRFITNITQEQMSEKLGISCRSYSDLKNGIYMCSAMVLIHFIINCNIDANKFFAELKIIIKEK